MARKLFVLFALVGVAWIAEPANAQQVIIVQPRNAPPPRVIVQEPAASNTVIVEPARRVAPTRTAPFIEHRSIGLHGDVGAMFAPDFVMGGFSGALRLRPIPNLAVDVGAGVFSGPDQLDALRLEIPLSLNVLAFVNPYDRVQLYFLAGATASLSRIEYGYYDYYYYDYYDAWTTWYAGGEFGIGLEFPIGATICAKY
ncbi:MAG: hypothetical protein R3A47_02685 [Polyangiales bacterium]